MSDLGVTEAELRDLFVDRLDVLTSSAFDEVSASAKRLRVPLELAIAERARLPVGFLHEQLADLWEVPFTELRISDVKVEALRRIRPDLAQKRMVAAFDQVDATLRVAAVNPRDTALAADLRQVTGQAIELVLATESTIKRAHLLYEPWLPQTLAQAGRGVAMPVIADSGRGEPTATEIAGRLLDYAVVSNASDVHLEPYEWEGIIRYRIDGTLHEVFSLTPQTYSQLVARLKVLSGMRVDEKRAPQDGRYGSVVGGTEVDMRVSSVPTHWGEKIVMRVLPKEALSIDLEGLGLTGDDYQRLITSSQRPFGMILVTGPTGSGKTTTLYATLARISTERQGRLNMSTIEDPVERLLPRVSQIAVNHTAGIDFAGGLRALLRQDPDVIMVGEIRDRETADIAVRAALVGRLLFATLHTNDASSAVARLIDMGVEPFLLASTLELVIAQRLVRRICTDCRETISLDSPAFQALKSTPAFASAVPALQRKGVLSSEENPLARVRLFRGKGCARCNGTGHRGRVGLFELLSMTDTVRELIVNRQFAASTIKAAAIEQGHRTMFEDALSKAFLGEVTIEEVLRSSA